jgi:hypothetical protein
MYKIGIGAQVPKVAPARSPECPFRSRKRPWRRRSMPGSRKSSSALEHPVLGLANGLQRFINHLHEGSTTYRATALRLNHVNSNWPASVNNSRHFLMPHDAGKSLCGTARSFALQHRSALLHEHARAREPASPVPGLCKRLSLEWSFTPSEEPLLTLRTQYRLAPARCTCAR